MIQLSNRCLFICLSGDRLVTDDALTNSSSCDKVPGERRKVCQQFAEVPASFYCRA